MRPFSTLSEIEECQADLPAQHTECTETQTLYRTNIIKQTLEVVLISAFDLLKFEE